MELLWPYGWCCPLSLGQAGRHRIVFPKVTMPFSSQLYEWALSNLLLKEPYGGLAFHAGGSSNTVYWLRYIEIRDKPWLIYIAVFTFTVLYCRSIYHSEDEPV